MRYASKKKREPRAPQPAMVDRKAFKSNAKRKKGLTIKAKPVIKKQTATLVFGKKSEQKKPKPLAPKTQITNVANKAPRVWQPFEEIKAKFNLLKMW